MCPDENSEEIQLSQQLQELAEEVSRVYGIDVETAKQNIQTVLNAFDGRTALDTFDDNR